MSFLATIEKLASTVGGALTGGALPVVVEIGKDVLNLIDEAKTVAKSDDVPALTALRDELEPKVMAHATATEKTLRGEK